MSKTKKGPKTFKVSGVKLNGINLILSKFGSMKAANILLKSIQGLSF